ncbi:MAG: S-layer homology domain-containing protein [Clostridia bacterium]|nr:S-layer homology domain-containing protein [Clostridia bacterium]
MKKKLIGLMLLLTILLSNITVSFAAPFSDISGHWAEDAITKWSGYNVINGYDGCFNPDGELTRAQMAIILSNLLGLTTKSENKYADVKESDWYYDAILKCTHAGIMSGDGTNASPNAPITREAAMVMIARALDIEDSFTARRTITDMADISDWARPKVYAMVNNGYVNGVGDNMIKPKDNISRAAIITILNNVIKKYITTPGEYTIDDDFVGIIVLKGNDIVLNANHNLFNVIIAEEYTYKLMIKNHIETEDEDKETSNSTSSSTSNSTQISGSSSSSGNSTGGGGFSGNSPDPNVKIYEIAFSDGSGSLLSQQTLFPGEKVNPPEEPKKIGHIFSGWDTDLRNIDTTKIIKALWTKTDGESNYFTLPVKYTLNENTIDLPIALCGKVDLCAFDIEIQYDKNCLEFIEISEEDDDVVSNHIFDEGVIKLNFMNSKNITGEIDICNMQFKVLNNTPSSEIKIIVKEVVKLDENGEFVNPEYNVHNGEVYVLD